MEVPLTDNNTYNYYKMYSLPILDQLRDETSIIIPEYPFLMVKGSKYLPVASPCLQISADDQYICNENNVVTFSTLTCMEQLMQFQSNLSLCSRRVVQMEEMKVQRLSSDSWIVYSRNNAVMSYKCGDDISKTTILGTYLVRIEPGCEIILW
ncbi:jg585 [Pararge aegeria aegeria]|uniref:Jg585 protein n=1 Tax=Pararge aegeria aegeria TaxID=348720 RepID=A0A8S4QQR3_9NEOP|nr:jg585 [Pararge aegeria aegeria]